MRKDLGGRLLNHLRFGVGLALAGGGDGGLGALSSSFLPSGFFTSFGSALFSFSGGGCAESTLGTLNSRALFACFFEVLRFGSLVVSEPGFSLRPGLSAEARLSTEARLSACAGVGTALL